MNNKKKLLEFGDSGDSLVPEPLVQLLGHLREVTLLEVLASGYLVC